MSSLYTFSISIQSFSKSVNKISDLGGPGGEAPGENFWDFRHIFEISVLIGRMGGTENFLRFSNRFRSFSYKNIH